VRFVTDGDPGWQRWDGSHPVRIFGDGEPHTMYGPRDREFAVWTADAKARAAAAAVDAGESGAEADLPPRMTPVRAAVARSTAARGAAARSAAAVRSAELRSVVRRLRLPGSVRRS
jgi:para-nitrobenzyl esterase